MIIQVPRGCSEYVADAGGQLVPCELPCMEVRLPCPAERPDAVARYCSEHGGAGRALDEARRDWMYAAPESVGGPAEVEGAGCEGLRTTEAYVVLRQLPEAQGSTWLAWLGLGSLLTPVANPTPRVRLQPDGQPAYSGAT